MSHDVDALMDEELDGLNDPSIEHLPEPPTLTGRGQAEEMYGEYAETPMGRASSPALFAQAALFPQCQQLRIWKLENGVPSGLGVIDADASEEDLIRTRLTAMPNPGDIRATFKLRPLDTNGREIGQELTLHISEHNPLISRMRNVGTPSNGGGGYGGMNPMEMGLLTRSLDITENRARLHEQTLDAERQRLLERDHQLAQERVDVAANAMSAGQAMSERMLEADQSRHQQVMETERARNEAVLAQQQTFMRSQVEMVRGDRDAMINRYNAEGERERQRFAMQMEREQERARQSEAERRDRSTMERAEYDRRLQREREEWDRRMDRERQDNEDRRTREAARLAAQESERQRQHEQRLKEMEMQAQQQREHAERMMTLSQQKEAAKTPSLIEQAKPVLGFLTDAGIDIKDVIGMIGGGGGDWTELLGTLAERVGGVAEKALEAKAAEANAQASASPQYMSSYPTAVGQLPQPNYAPPLGPGGVPLMDADFVEDYDELYSEPLVQHVESQQPAPQMSQQPPSVAAPTGASPPPGAQAGGARLGLQAQKTARNALRALIQRLGTVPQTEWPTEIMVAIGNEMTIYHYVQDVSVRRAMAEAGASTPMIEQIIAALKSNPAVPGDLRYE